MNRLSEHQHDLIPINVTEIITRIQRALQRQSLFRVSPAGRYLQIEADTIATEVAAGAENLRHPLGSGAHLAQAASVHFGQHRERTQQLLHQLAQTIRDQLTTEITAQASNDPATFLAALLQSMATLTGQGDVPGFHYPFATITTTQQLQRLTVHPARDAKGLLDSHHVTVTLTDSDSFAGALAAGVRRATQTEFAALEPADADELENILDEQEQGKQADLQRVSRTVLGWSLSAIKREVQLRYLEYLRDTLGTSGGAVFLADLVRRLRLLDAYLGGQDRPDGDFLVSYAGSRPINYRDLFQQASAFDLLPIIPLIEGTLSSVADQPRGQHVWTFGLKLKLDGPVYRMGTNPPRVYEYYLGQLNPDSAEHVGRREAGADDPRFAPRVLHLALLYAIVFADFGNLAYDPITPFDRDVLPLLRGADDAAKVAVLRRVVSTISQPSVFTGLRTLRRWLQEQLRRQTVFPSRTFAADLVLTRAILERDLERILAERTLFRQLDPDGYMVRRAMVVADPQISGSALARLSVQLTVQVQRYIPVASVQSLDLAYAADAPLMLPVLVAPRDKSRTLYRTYFKHIPLITIPYTSTALDARVEDRVDGQAFVTRFTYGLLSYLGLHAILGALGQRPFVPILRLHDGSEDTTMNGQAGEAAIAAICKVLAHLLSVDASASTQGLNVAELLKADASGRPVTQMLGNAWRYKLLNGLSSLYAPLPKQLHFGPAETDAIEHVAVVMVGSRVADRSREGTAQLTTLYGEAIGITHQDSNLTVRTEGTLVSTDTLERLRTEPTALIDLVQRLTDAGYRHILYVAHAPDASTMLGVTGESEDLFWLAPSIIAALRRGRSDITLYPIFFDAYRALKRSGYRPGVQAYDIHDPKELQPLLADPNRQAVVFYALFNGQQVGNDPESRLYNGVVTYLTLLNRYGDVLDDRDLHVGLLVDGPRKTMLLRSLLAVHYARYEAAARRGVSLKLNPYAAIIGDRALGSVAGFPHLSGTARFNLLAFLGEVRAILGAPAVAGDNTGTAA